MIIVLIFMLQNLRVEWCLLYMFNDKDRSDVRVSAMKERKKSRSNGAPTATQKSLDGANVSFTGTNLREQLLFLPITYSERIRRGLAICKGALAAVISRIQSHTAET